MAEMFLPISVSLDGYIEVPNGDIEWMTSDLSLDAIMTAMDEIRLIQYPILLGDGTPLFSDAGIRRQLKLTGSEAFDSGAALQRYRFA